jgi:hypothetical protein
MRRDGSVGIATGYELDYQGVGVRVLVESRMFFSYASFRLVLGAHPIPIQWVPGSKAAGA